MTDTQTFPTEKLATVGSGGKIEVLGRAYWSPKMCNYIGWTVRVMVPKDEHEAIQVWRGSHFLASADRILDPGFVAFEDAKALVELQAEIRRVILGGRALRDPHPADRDRRRTASRSVAGARTPQPHLRTERTGSPVPPHSTDQLHTGLQDPASPRRSELDMQPVSGEHGATADLSHHQEAEDRHLAGKETVPEREPRTSLQGGEAHPAIARRLCREGRPCPRVRAALASGSTVPLRDNRDDQYSWCSLGPANRFRWFICEDSDACLKAHRLRDTPVQTPKKRGAARLLSAFLDLIFGRRA